MGQVSTVTIGSTNYSVYALTADPVADANGYFAARLGAAVWTAADTTTKKQALVSAVRMIDRRATFTGTKTVANQPLEWPRNSATNCGEAVPDGTIPDDIVLAEFEMALALLENEAVQDTQNVGSNIKRAKAGSAEVEYFVPTIGTTAATQFPTPVQELLQCYLDSATARLLAGPQVTGINPDCCNQRSTFDECNPFGLNGGL